MADDVIDGLVVHLGGRAKLSTFRRTLDAILGPSWGADRSEAALTQWMDSHLRVVPVAVDDADGLRRIEQAVLQRLDPPLSLRGMLATPLRSKLGRPRRSADRQAQRRQQVLSHTIRGEQSVEWRARLVTRSVVQSARW